MARLRMAWCTKGFSQMCVCATATVWANSKLWPNLIPRGNFFRKSFQSDHYRPVPFDHLRWCILHSFLDFPTWLSKGNWSSFQIQIAGVTFQDEGATFVWWSNCRGCLWGSRKQLGASDHQMLFAQTKLAPKILGLVKEINLTGPHKAPKIQGEGWKCHPTMTLGLLLGIFGRWFSTPRSVQTERVGSQFFVCLFCHRSPSKLMNLKVIQFLLAGAHPLRANAVEHLGIAVSETLRDAQNCGH